MTESRIYGSRGRVSGLGIVVFALLFGFAGVRGFEGLSAPLFHVVAEALAASLAAFAGVMALARYYSRKDAGFLLIGTGFVGVAVLDGYHSVISALDVANLTLAQPSSLIMWSWFASRTFLGLTLWLSAMATVSPTPGKGLAGAKDWVVYGAGAALVAGAIAVVAVVPLPAIGGWGAWVARPQELLPAVLFGMALAGWWRVGRWRSDAFQQYLILSLMVNVVGQVGSMAFSRQALDVMFDAAHACKLFGYGLVVAGSLASVLQLLRRAERSTDEARQANIAIVKEMAERERAVEALRMEQERFQVLLKLNEMGGASFQTLTDFALEQGVRLTRSQIGYLAFMNEDESVLTMHSWSKTAMEQCAIINKPIVYPVVDTGLWGEAVRQRRPVITNNYAVPNPLKKGYPAGHVPVERHMNVPVFDGKRIVAVAGVGNKQQPYDDTDAMQLQLLMTGMWQLIQRGRTSEALQASRQLFSQFMDHSPAIAYMKDDQGRLLYVNATYERVFKTLLAKVKGKRDAELWSPEVAAEQHANDQAVYEGGKTAELIETMPTPDGGPRQWLAFKFPFKDMEARYCLGAVAVDITDRLQAEEELRLLNETLEQRVAERTMLAEQRTRELERSNRELERFAHVASHDLQEPLRMVSSYTQLLGQRYKGKLDADADEFIRFAVEGAKRMQRLIVDLLAYSRAGRDDKPLAPTDVGAALKQAMVRLKVSLEACGATVASDELPTVMADAAQLMLLFQNMIENAIKFRAQEALRISVTARRQENEWRFSVRDNGLGMPLEHRDRLFLLFQRLHDRDKYPGSGIGLAVCKKIVERHGGRIWVESTPGQGATFYFTMPASGGKKP